MKKEAILHMPLSSYAYAIGKEDITVRIRCQKDDIKKCTLYYGDRADPKKEITLFALDMDIRATDDLFDYYEVSVKEAFPRICYFFELDDGKESVFYNERGFDREISSNRTEYFQFPYIRREDKIGVPEWAKNVIMYQIFPDSFADGYRKIAGKSKKKDFDDDGYIVKSRGNLGGTLSGIRENLDYIKGLGISCIYLNPVFMANSYHKYDTADYFKVDACFGEMNDLKELVRECHEMGIRVLLDGVFNHSGPDFFAFRDVLEKGKESKYFGWFYDMPDQVKYADPPNYAAFAYVKEMPKLNTGNPELEEYLINVGTYWIKEADIDGWRLDVANEVNHDFWRRFRKAVREVKPDAFLIGEIWEDSQCWLEGDQFDSTMNYRFANLCKEFFADRTMPVTEFDAGMQKMIMRYPTPISLAQMNFLDTHDVPRFMTYCQDDRRRLMLAYFYLFTGVGIPSVFYGDECFIAGKEEPEYRSPMRWNSDDNFSDLLAKLAKLRNDFKSLRMGSYKKIAADDENNVYAFERKYEEEKLTIVINNSDEEKEISALISDGFLPVYGDIKMIGNCYIIPAMSAVVFR